MLLPCAWKEADRKLRCRHSLFFTDLLLDSSFLPVLRATNGWAGHLALEVVAQNPALQIGTHANDQQYGLPAWNSGESRHPVCQKTNDTISAQRGRSLPGTGSR